MDAATRTYIREKLDKIARARARRAVCPLPIGAWLICAICHRAFKKTVIGKPQEYCSRDCYNKGSKGR